MDERAVAMTRRWTSAWAEAEEDGAVVEEDGVDIWERNKEMIRKRTDISEHFTREVFQSIVFIFLPLGERVHLTNQISCYYPFRHKECLSMRVINREDCNRSLLLTLVRMIYCSNGEANGI